MKNTFYLIVTLIFFVSCKPTSLIITSKAEAKKKIFYTNPKGTTVIKTEKQYKRISNTKLIKNELEIEPQKNQKSRLSTENYSEDLDISKDDTSYLVEQLINSASENLGLSYKSGGTSSDGYDCSGLMFSTFYKFGIILPRSSNEMSQLGTVLKYNEIKKGDFVFFRTNGRKIINHVGMVVEVLPNEIKFIHSATSKGVIISSTKEPYYSKNFAQSNRIYSALY